jgi:glutamate/tyrosine decarboxylase-like PLP-dependent enzyme
MMTPIRSVPSHAFLCTHPLSFIITWFESLFRFAHTNPLHLDVFQSVVRFEAEVVAMTAALLGSKEKGSGGQICGNMTSGGTESILLAVKSSRDYMKTKKGITKPEMYCPRSNYLVFSTSFLIWKLFKCVIFILSTG